MSNYQEIATTPSTYSCTISQNQMIVRA